MSGSENVQLTISVGGTKCELAAVGIESRQFLARSGRIEWTRMGVLTFPGFVSMLAREANNLLNAASIPPGRVAGIGVAWPGPQVGEHCLATFIPGGDTPQPFAGLLKDAMAGAIDPHFETVSVTVRLDAIARATGELLPGGALHMPAGSAPVAGMLVNLATGIAGGIVFRLPVLSVPGIGQNYGQFGRFLHFDTVTREWDWRASADGSVPKEAPTAIRWTRLSAGPALAGRFGLWAEQTGVNAPDAPLLVRDALRHFSSRNAVRDTALEKTLLSWITIEANQNPLSPAAEFVRRTATEVGGALRFLLDVFSEYPIDRIVLAGGVGEYFGGEIFFTTVQDQFRGTDCILLRSRLGVEAELLGFAAVGVEAR